MCIVTFYYNLVTFPQICYSINRDLIFSSPENGDLNKFSRLRLHTVSFQPLFNIEIEVATIEKWFADAQKCEECDKQKWDDKLMVVDVILSAIAYTAFCSSPQKRHCAVLCGMLSFFLRFIREFDVSQKNNERQNVFKIATIT